MDKTRILVVDDEKPLCDTLKFNLELEGYLVDTAYSAEEALAMDLSQYSLLILDVMMGEISGFQLAGIMKRSASLSTIPIIFCTALGSEEDTIKGLDLGGDDYIAKPYSFRTMVARIRTVLRRTSTPIEEPEVITFEGMTLNLNQKSCSVNGEDIKLPRKEFEILRMLLSSPGRIFSREEILQRVWPDDVVVLQRVVDVNVTRLRGKLGEYGKLIVTRSGYGYGFQA